MDDGTVYPLFEELISENAPYSRYKTCSGKSIIYQRT